MSHNTIWRCYTYSIFTCLYVVVNLWFRKHMSSIEWAGSVVPGVVILREGDQTRKEGRREGASNHPTL